MSDEVFNVLMVGVGGQGIVLASDVLAEAAMLQGLDVKKSEIHGMSQRGGPVFSHVRFGPEVFSPVIPQGEADVLFALERMELLRWAAWAKPDAMACYLAQTILPAGVDAYPEGVDAEISRLFDPVVAIDPSSLRGKASTKVRNTVLLGVLSVWTPLDPATMLTALDNLVPAGTADMNRSAFELGRQIGIDSKEASLYVE